MKNIRLNTYLFVIGIMPIILFYFAMPLVLYVTKEIILFYIYLSSAKIVAPPSPTLVASSSILSFLLVITIPVFIVTWLFSKYFLKYSLGKLLLIINIAIFILYAAWIGLSFKFSYFYIVGIIVVFFISFMKVSMNNKKAMSA
ncbi:MAG: hypothetical protein KF690_10470 [Bacteroidetes bacterium]|nr:hypothetical protein [Bacteroidota bacterium]